MSDKPTTSSWVSRGAVKPAATPPEAAGDERREDGFTTVNPAKRQPQLMLNLRLKDGSAIGLAYAYLSAVRFDPSAGITLEMAGYVVQLKGVHLRRLYVRLLAHAVGSIQESDPLAHAPDGGPKATAVFDIKVEKA